MTSFRVATNKDSTDFFGKAPTHNFKGIVAVKDNKIIGIGGLLYTKEGVIAFSEIKDEMKKNKKDIVRGCRILIDMIKKENRSVYAVADKKEPTSQAFLKRLGFVRTGLFNENGETLVWGK